MRNYFTWQGISSANLTNFIIEDNVTIKYPKKRHSETYIPRNNVAIVRDDGFEMLTIEIPIILTGTPTLTVGSTTYSGRDALDYFFFYAETQARWNFRNQLVLSPEGTLVYDAYLFDGFDLETFWKTKKATVKFLCQPLKRKVDANGLPASFVGQAPASDSSKTIDVGVSGVSRLPKLFIRPVLYPTGAYEAVMKIASVSPSSLFVPNGFVGRWFLISVPAVGAMTYNKPVYCCDFENDNFYICQFDTSHPLTAANCVNYYSFENRKADLIKFCHSIVDITATGTEDDYKAWHELNFHAENDFFSFQMYNLAGDELPSAADYVYFPEVRVI